MNKYVIGLVVLIIIIGGYWSWKGHNVQPTAPIKIGGLFGLTGYAAFAGEASRNGFLMAMEDSGMNVPYVVEDFRSDLKGVVTGASKLIDVDNVTVVIGPEWNEFSQIIMPIATTKKTLFISPWMSGDAQWINSPYFFSGTPSERTEIKAVLDRLVARGDTTLGVVYSKNAWSKGIFDWITEEAGKMEGKIKIVATIDPNETATDYRTEITKLKQARPDAVFIALATDDATNIFLKQYKELGGETPLYMPYSRGVVLAGSARTNAVGVIYPAVKDYEKTKEFNTRYEQKYGMKPAAISGVVAYDMTTLVLSAIKSGAKTTDEIVAYLRNLKNYKGYSGVIEFTDRGLLKAREVELRRVTNNGYEMVQ